VLRSGRCPVDLAHFDVPTPSRYRIDGYVLRGPGGEASYRIDEKGTCALHFGVGFCGICRLAKDESGCHY